MNKLLRLLALPLTGLGLLVACGGDGGTAPSTAITVTGVAQDRVGERISGATVLVPGKSPVTSGSDGRFSIPGVEAPYDIALILNSRNTAVVYKGLTRSDPTLRYPDFTGAEQTATISGTTPPSAGNLTAVLFASGKVSAVSTADPTTGAYTMTARWRSFATTYSGELYVLRGTGGTALPTSYDGFARKPLTISAGGDFSGNDFAAADLTDPPELSVGGTVAVPGGYTLNQRAIVFDFGSGPSLIWWERGPLPSAFTYALPAVGGVGFRLMAWAEDPASRVSIFSKSGIAGNSANVTIPLEAAAQLIAPANGAAAVDITTPFTWTQGGGTGVNVFSVIPSGSTDPRFFVFTTGADATIPDLSSQGVSLPPAAGYRWFVNRLFPLASVNEAAGEGFLPFLEQKAGDIGETSSGGFGFTTKAAAGTALRTSAVAPPGVAAPPVQRPLWMRRLDAVSTAPR